MAVYEIVSLAYDFVFDHCADGSRLKCLTVVDERAWERLVIEVESRLRSGKVIEILEKLFQQHGPPQHIRSDDGPEFVARAIFGWLREKSADAAIIEPGKPWRNGTNESFNGKFRDECLNME